MITITLEELINSSEGLKELSRKSLKARSAYAVGKILKAADNEITSFNETRAELIKKYGEKRDDGELNTDEEGNVRIIPESLETFNKELQELLETSVEINANKINGYDIEDVQFTPAEMVQLESFIDFE